MIERFIVREVAGMCYGAGMFVVVDTLSGFASAAMYWRDEADRVAARLNIGAHHD